MSEHTVESETHHEASCLKGMGFRCMTGMLLVKRLDPYRVSTYKGTVTPLIRTEKERSDDERLSQFVVVYGYGSGVCSRINVGTVAVLGRKWGGSDILLAIGDDVAEPFIVVSEKNIVAIVE